MKVSEEKKKKFGLSSVYGLKELIEPACRVQYMWSVEKKKKKCSKIATRGHLLAVKS